VFAKAAVPSVPPAPTLRVEPSVPASVSVLETVSVLPEATETEPAPMMNVLSWLAVTFTSAAPLSE
jgi:hypothetical protein